MPSTFKAPCAIPTCPHRKPCPVHGRPADRDRGTARQRGYDTAHDREAEQHRPRPLTRCPSRSRGARVLQPFRRGQARTPVNRTGEVQPAAAALALAIFLR
jgi:hypothetical protein